MHTRARSLHAMTTLEATAVFGSGTVAGIVNSIAGGGTLVSFPMLVALGRDPLLANATNSVGLCAGSLASAFGFRQHAHAVKHRLPVLLAVPLVGGIVGAWLLVHTGSSTFAGLIPYLILGATLLFALQERLARIQGAPRLLAWPMLFGIGIYGGYFGAGIGILLLATLGILGLADIHEKNVVKNLVAFAVNGTAALFFLSRGVVIWGDALLLGAGAIVGGYAGARLAQRLGRAFVRQAVVAIGFGLTLWYFTHPAR